MTDIDIPIDGSQSPVVCWFLSNLVICGAVCA
jgi:hypothetical protein